MKLHSTNYTNTFIMVADDCPSAVGLVPPQKNDTKSIASLQFEIISKNPYRYTSDDVLFLVHASRNDLLAEEYEAARCQLFSKGQACFRSSPLTKRYGWGLHSNHEGKIAIYGVETEAYIEFVNDSSIKKVKALRSQK